MRHTEVHQNLHHTVVRQVTSLSFRLCIRLVLHQHLKYSISPSSIQHNPQFSRQETIQTSSGINTSSRKIGYIEFKSLL